ncbi:MAG: nucleotidyltransferase domain-containing protein [Legionellales bacterium]|nr:nucleotidyltransferase domain-containing protein [Legionellales bacterium]
MIESHPAIDLKPNEWAEVIGLLRRHVPTLEVWAFGSRVKGTAKPYSDLDLALITTTPLPLEQRAILIEAFDQSNLPINVDIVDWSNITEAFRKIIMQHKVVIQA